MKHLVSVIIPAYNREKLILEAVESVLNQTYQNLEVIVVDDGSVDNTRQAVESIEDSRVKYIYQNNAGPSAARNNGIKNSVGEYVAFLDSDDLWLPEKLEKQMGVVSDNDNIGAISCFAQYTTFDKKPISKRTCRSKNNKQYCQFLLLEPNTVLSGTSTMIIKKNCFEEVGYFDESMISREDWDMWFRVCLKYEFKCIEDVLMYSRCNIDSLSKTTEMAEVLDNYMKFLEKIYSRNDLPDYISQIKNEAYSNAYWNMAYSAIYRKNKHLRDLPFAKKSLFKSLKYSFKKIFKPTFIIACLLVVLPGNFIDIYSGFKNFIKKIKP